MNGAAELLRVERRATDDAPAATADGLLEAARLAASAALLIWSCDTRSMSVLARWRCRCKDVVLGAVVDGASAITLQAVNQFTAVTKSQVRKISLAPGEPRAEKPIKQRKRVTTIP